MTKCCNVKRGPLAPRISHSISVYVHQIRQETALALREEHVAVAVAVALCKLAS